MNGYDEDYIEDGWSCEDAAARHDALQCHKTDPSEDVYYDALNAANASAPVARKVAVTISEDEEPF